MTMLQTETRKLSTLRLPWAALAAAAVLPGALSALFVHEFADRIRISVPGLVAGVAQPAWFVVIVVAVLAAASEFQHGTVVTTLLTTPRRIQVLASKSAVSAGYGIVLTAVAAVATVAGAALMAAIEDVPLVLGTGTELRGGLGAVVLGGLWAVVACSLGLLTRSTALALTTVLIWKFVLEGIVPVVFRNPGIGDWLPSGAANAAIGAGRADMSALTGLVVIVGYAAVLAVLAALSFVRRDPL
jgi:ABC-2 type transport system permease protein